MSQWQNAKLRQKLASGEFVVVVSLPRNDIAFAQAAVRGGADGVKMHLNVIHRVSKVDFGTWEEERQSIEEVIGAVDVSVGVVPGAEVTESSEQLHDMFRAGVDYVDAYVQHIPAEWLREGAKMPVVAALSHGFTEVEARDLGEISSIAAVEASIVSPDGYGKPLTLSDIMAYRRICRIISKPVLVPSQRKIEPGDLPLLAEVGVRGIIIGGVVTGFTVDGVESVTRAFKAAANNLHIESPGV